MKERRREGTTRMSLVFKINPIDPKDYSKDQSFHQTRYFLGPIYYRKITRLWQKPQYNPSAAVKLIFEVKGYMPMLEQSTKHCTFSPFLAPFLAQVGQITQTITFFC